MFCLHACLCPASLWCLWRFNEALRAPEIGVTDGCEPHCVHCKSCLSSPSDALQTSLCLQFYFADSVIFRNIPKNPCDRKNKIHILVPWWAVLALDEQYFGLVTSCLRWSGCPLLRRAWAQRLAEGVIPFSATSLLRVQNLPLSCKNGSSTGWGSAMVRLWEALKSLFRCNQLTLELWRLREP